MLAHVAQPTGFPRFFFRRRRFLQSKYGLLIYSTSFSKVRSHQLTEETAMTRDGTWMTTAVLAATLALTAAGAAHADDATTLLTGEALRDACTGLPSHSQLKSALDAAQGYSTGNGGFGFNMWGTVVNRNGIVCAVAFTGTDSGAQWPGSRNISAQKANTANAFSLPGFALSTANLYAATQPGGSLFGLQASNPVSTEVAYRGPATNFGQSNDPMLGSRIGGVNVFGGGLALYTGKGTLIGAVGVSGDTSCADHNIAWRTRHNLLLDYVPAGVSQAGDDNINYQGFVPELTLAHDFSHPVCSIKGSDAVVNVSTALPPVRKLGAK
jgi:uncharacterized protein GlcG (DUF336 family)